MTEKAFSVAVLLSILLGVACSRAPQHKQITTFTELKGGFADPPASYRTVPFWVWNDRVTRAKIDHQLERFKRQGVGGVFIHPRYGLITQYLSGEWFDLVKYAVERARQLGLHIWIYDENSYPSGFAGGHVPAEMPDSYRHGQGLVLEKRDSLPDTLGESYPVVLARTDTGFVPVSGPTDVPAGAREFYLFKKVWYPKSKWFAGFSYVDLLYPGVTRKFIQVTMRGYERAVGDQFGKTVPGVFTDEPNIRPPRGNAIRWTPDLFERFREWMGYDLRPRLVSLFERVGDWRKVRHDYQRVLLRLFTERWSKPWRDYCERHGLAWTGHYWEHAWPDPAHGPDNIAMYAYHQIPAIDMLFNQFHEGVNAQFGNVRSVREVASVANQYGRARVLSETYGGAGWEITFADMKRLGEWEYVLGINLMNQHLAFMSLKGDRKQDYPQSFLDHEPWWHLYHYLADHFGRLSLALSAGRAQNPLLVIEPTTTAWMYAGPGVPRDSLNARVGEPFQSFVTRLAHEQVEYDIGSEWILGQIGRVEDGAFVVGKAKYAAVVLPPGTENLESSTVDLLRKDLESGGTVYCFGSPPSFVDGVPSDRVAELASAHPQNWIALSALDDEALQKLGSWQPLQVKVEEGSWVFHQRRALADGQLLFLANSSPEEAARGTVAIPGASVSRLDPFTGEIKAYAFDKEGDKVRMSFELQPLGSMLLFVHSEGSQVAAASKERGAVRETPVPSAGLTSVSRDSLNVLTLDYCDVSVDTFVAKGVYFVEAQNAIWRHHGYEENPWFRGIQFGTQLVDADTFGAGTGFEASYWFNVLENPGTRELYAVVEQPTIWQVLVNGERVETLPGRHWLDPDFALYPIADKIRVGRNEIRIVCKPMSIYAELEPVYVLGDFSLVPRERGWAIVKARPLGFGPWKDQGCPFYGHSVTYTKRVELGHVGPDSRVFVKLGRWAGSVAEVRVNGASVGIIAWPPYELDVTSACKPGVNEVQVVVYGSLKNPLGPHHEIRRRGITGPWDFRRAPAQQPPGESYDVLPYGLFEDSRVVARRPLASS